MKIKYLYGFYAGSIFEGKLISRERSHVPDVDWITLEHPTEEYTNLWGETYKMLYCFRSDIIEIIEEENVITREGEEIS